MMTEKLSIVPQKFRGTSLILDIKLINQLDLNELRIHIRSGMHYDGVSSAALGATLSVSEHCCQ